MSSKIPSQVNSRKLLLHTPLPKPGTDSNTPPSDPSLSDSGTSNSNFDANVVMILAVLLCALICALGLNSIIRCTLRCSNQIRSEPEQDQAGRVAATRARRKAIRAMPVTVCAPELKLNGAGMECAICLLDIVTGERVQVLPNCNHGFHVKCIDRWLMTHPSCPNCRQCLFTTDLKSSGCGEVDAGTGTNSGTGMVHMIIVPMEPERFIHDYRGVS